VNKQPSAISQIRWILLLAGLVLLAGGAWLALGFTPPTGMSQFWSKVLKRWILVLCVPGFVVVFVSIVPAWRALRGITDDQDETHDVGFTSRVPHSNAPVPTGPILSARSIHKTYRLGRVGVPVLRGVDLEVERGSWIAVLGASGSGKSTLLHLLGGLDRPDTPAKSARHCRRCGYSRAGLSNDTRCPECDEPQRTLAPPHIVYEGRELSGMSTAELDRYRSGTVGFVFQFYHLLPELSVLENVTIGAMVLHGRFGYMKARSEARDRARELLDTFGLGHRLRHRPRELSGGERQRVAIARALINRPKILLADEPTGNLDRTTGGSILDAIEAIREAENLTMVMVTHDPTIAERAARTVNLVDGVVVDKPVFEES